MLGKGVGSPPFFSAGIQFSTKLDAHLSSRYPKWFVRDGEQDLKQRLKYIKKEVENSEKYWDDFLYGACDGDITKMETLRRVDIIDFFSYVENKMKKNG